MRVTHDLPYRPKKGKFWDRRKHPKTRPSARLGAAVGRPGWIVPIFTGPRIKRKAQIVLITQMFKNTTISINSRAIETFFNIFPINDLILSSRHDNNLSSLPYREIEARYGSTRYLANAAVCSSPHSFKSCSTIFDTDSIVASCHSIYLFSLVPLGSRVFEIEIERCPSQKG